jgi:hypothetical protein
MVVKGKKSSVSPKDPPKSSVVFGLASSKLPSIAAGKEPISSSTIASSNRVIVERPNLLLRRCMGKPMTKLKIEIKYAQEQQYDGKGSLANSYCIHTNGTYL